MTVSNKYLRQLEEERSKDLETLAQLSRDLDAHLRGKQTVKTKIPAKYVGVTKAQGDAQYQTNLTRFGAKNLGRAFGVNMSLMELHNDTRAELEAMLGSGAALRDYVDICTEVIIHIIAQAAARMTAAQSSELQTGYELYMDKLRATSKVTEALKALNSSVGLFVGRVFTYLAPINRSYVEALQAVNLSKIEARGDMIKFIANSNAQLAVSRYITKKRPSDDVLLPGSIGSSLAGAVSPISGGSQRRRQATLGLSAGSTPDEASVIFAFSANPSKDVVATYNYYRAAVDSEIDAGTGIRLGDVEASLKAAQEALRNAASAMSLTGISSKEANLFSNAFRKIAKSVGSHKVSDLDVSTIHFEIADLLDLIGAYDGVGTGNLTSTGSTVFDSSFPAAQITEVENILKQMPSAYATMGSGLGQQDVAFLDAQDAVRPINVNDYETKKPNLAAVRNNVSLALISLQDACVELGSGVSLGVQQVTRVLDKEPKVTGPFKNLIFQQIDSAQSRFASTMVSANIDGTVYAAAINEMYTQILGVTTIGGNLIEVENASLNKASNTWDITDARFEQIADGRVPNLSSRSADGRTIEQVLVDFVDREFAASATRGTASKRRATRDVVLQSAQLFCDVLDGVRLQAEYSGMVVRQNPMGDLSGLQIAGVATGSLVGTHALSALTNRFVQPKHGTVMSHVADLAPSLAVIGTGAYLAHSKGQKDLGYSLAGGAAGHLALRYLMKHVPALRFSDNIAAKVLQAPTSGLAHLLGDTTMGVSGLTPADCQDHKGNLAEYVCSLICTNSASALPYIVTQLWQSGLNVKTSELEGDAKGTDITFSCEGARNVARSAIKDDKVALAQVATLMVLLNTICENADDCSCSGDIVTCKPKDADKAKEGLEASVKKALTALCSVLGCSTSDNELGMLMFAAMSLAAVGTDQAADMAKAAASLVGGDATAAVPPSGAGGSGVDPNLGGFILEPGYNMDVYSGEDQVSYLQPAPQMTSQAGFTQLEDAIARSEQLGPQEKMMEGIGDLQDVAIIRATPSDARMVENMGAGVSLGQSRSNPSKELVALEVEGDNGLMSVTPARQHSVPQGGLNYAKIGHAQNVDVSPHGLFNRGAFNPAFGR